MLFGKKELVERPKKEKKFSLKNPEDVAILITYTLVALVIILIIFLIIKFGNLVPENTSSNISNDLSVLTKFIGGNK